MIRTEKIDRTPSSCVPCSKTLKLQNAWGKEIWCGVGGFTGAVPRSGRAITGCLGIHSVSCLRCTNRAWSLAGVRDGRGLPGPCRSSQENIPPFALRNWCGEAVTQRASTGSNCKVSIAQSLFMWNRVVHKNLTFLQRQACGRKRVNSFCNANTTPFSDKS